MLRRSVNLNKKLAIVLKTASLLFILIIVNNIALQNSGLLKATKQHKIEYTQTKEPSYHLHELSHEEPYRSRLIDIMDKCRGKNKNEQPSFLTSSFKYNDDVKVAMCETPKVASTTWQLLLLRLGGYNKKIDKYILREWAYDKIPNKQFSELANENEAVRRLKSHVTFFLTRHPFERLVSAYSDKFTNRTDVTAYRDREGKMIAKKQAKDYMHGMHTWIRVLMYMENENINLIPQFQQLNDTQKNDVLKYVHVLKTGEISFMQFVRFVIEQYNNKDAMDIHWLPQTELCKPCFHNYSYVIKFENLARESNKLLEYLQKDNNNTQANIEFPSSRSNKVKDDIAKNAFKEIPEPKVEILRKIYADDFHILNHDPYLYHGHS